jgi:zinc transporter
LSETVSDERAALLRLRRSISRQNRLVHAIRAVLEQFEQPRLTAAPKAYRELALRIGQRIASFQADIHLHADRARMLQDEMSAQIATGTNQNLFVLTIVTTILLPPAFVTGFFGMNTKGLPFSDSDYGTLFAAMFCGAAALLVYVLIRRYRMFN